MAPRQQIVDDGLLAGPEAVEAENVLEDPLLAGKQRRIEHSAHEALESWRR
jgi:hypothetical protein